MFYNYNEIIEAINNYSISRIVFKIKNYKHYDNCVIKVKKDLFPKGNKIYLIEINLTKDNSERYCFYKKFSEDCKIFHMGRKGSYTLKQLWNEVEIIIIEEQ